MNFVHVLPRFTPVRLVTEWFMTFNALFCTVLVVLGCFSIANRAPEARDGSYAPWIRKAVVLGLLGAIAVTFVGWSAKRALFGDHVVNGNGPDQIRFGPNNTNTIK